MAVTVTEILRELERFAPPEMKLDFDNVGLLAGFPSAPVTRVLAALDITDDVIAEAQETGAELIVSHHPLIFHALKRVTADEPTGRKVIRLIEGHVSAICMHTNLDAAEGGVNDALMEALGAAVTGLLDAHGEDGRGRPYGIGRIGLLPQPMPLEAFLARVKGRLGCSGVRYVPGSKAVEKLACCGGSGGDMLERAHAAGCDTFVTADLKYDRLLAAKELGINLIDADHFCTENVVIPKLVSRLETAFPGLDVRISARHGQTARFY